MSDRPFVRVEPLPYAERLASRALDDVDLVVIHCTELPDLATARRFGEQVHYAQSRTGNCGHYYIDRDGSIHEYVPVDRSAHHTRGYNARSVGIELVHNGRYPDWLDSRHQAMDEPYTPMQIQALVALLQQLQSMLPALRWIAGHEDLDTSEVQASDNAECTVRRKRDPGPQFPWDSLGEMIALRRLDPAAGG